MGIVGPDRAAVTMQLEAELQLLGFQVVRAAPPERATPHDLHAVARELDVAAAIFVDAHGTEIDLWVADRVTGKTVVRSVSVDQPGTADAARIAAVRAIELLRASFRELEGGPPPPEAEVAPSQPVQRTIRSAVPRFGLAFGPAIMGSPGGLGATAHVFVAVHAMPHRIVGVGLRAFAPIVGARVEAPEGTTRIHTGWFGVGPRFALARAHRVVQPSLGVSVGPAFVGMRGEARAPYVGRRDLVVSAMMEADFALAIAVHARVRIMIDAAIAVAVPRVGIRFAGRRIAVWGMPIGVGVLGVQVLL